MCAVGLVAVVLQLSFVQQTFQYTSSLRSRATDRFREKTMDFSRPRDYYTSWDMQSRRTTDANRAVRCYNCMSKAYKSDWDWLKVIYRNPLVFTDRCDAPFIGRFHVPTQPCSSLCVTMNERFYSAGIYIGDRYIRGCLDNITVNGFNDSAIKTHRLHFDASCRRLPRSLLIKPDPKLGTAGGGWVTMCSCFKDRCNGGSANISVRNRQSVAYGLLCLVMLWTLVVSSSLLCSTNNVFTSYSMKTL